MAQQIDINGLFNSTTEESWLYKEYKKQTMAQQTAVEWLTKELQKQGFVLYDFDIKQAKQMEKEQIINAFWNGDNSDCTSEQNAKEFAEKYYNETYNK